MCYVDTAIIHFLVLYERLQQTNNLHYYGKMEGGWQLCIWILLFLLQCGYCQYRKLDLTAATCVMSSRYTNGPGSSSLDCRGAINGNNGTWWTAATQPGENCISTSNSDTAPYWQVDLGQTYNIHRIIVYPELQWPQYMVNTLVLVDNVPVAQFASVQTQLQNPLSITNVSRGRVIKLTQSFHRYVTVCEVQVEDCSSGYYKQGDNCVPCGDGCQGTCNVTGHCTCQSGWQPTQCQTQCGGGQYGQDCLQTCSAGCQPDTCDAVIGNCTCKAGWTGLQCERCSSGYYNTTNPGSAACRKCGDGCGSGTCEDFTGNCTCRPGWQPPTCLECMAGMFGADCNQTCSVGCNNTCDVHNGTCSCKEGWHSDTCVECTLGYYNNSGTCKPCGLGCNDMCDKQTGECTCSPGWSPKHCLERCESGQFGQDCLETCAAGCDGVCDVITGNCSCRPHWQHPDCTDCQAGYYGNETNCTSPCGAGCQGPTSCETHTGRCKCKEDQHWESGKCETCVSGYWGGNCSLTCGNCTDRSCNQQSGTCESCVPGWKGPACQDPVVSSSMVAGPPVGPVAGGIVGGAVALIIVVVVVVLLIRRQRQGRVKNPIYGGASGDENPELSSLQQSGPSNTRSMEAPQLSQVKPKVAVKPMKRNTSVKTQQSADAGHIYSNTVGDGTTGGNIYGNNIPTSHSNGAHGAAHSAHSRQDGARRVPPDPHAPPSVPQRAAGTGRVYENVTVPVRNEQPSETDNAHSRPSRGSYRNQRSESEGDLGEGDDDDVYHSEDIYSCSQPLASQHFDHFQRYLIKCLGSGRLAAQFAKLPKGMKHPHKAGMTDENRCKNRFKAICAYDFNRVMLRDKPDSSSDYINASYIKGADENTKRYIATQGPRDNTVGDLWWMIWQEGVTQIVMLTNIKEDGKDKCEEYWPASGHSQTYDHVTVRGLEEQQRADFVIRPFTIKVAGQKSRDVTQYHYMAWPDHGVPKAASLVDFWKYAKGRNNDHVPLLVHCSAGVGRTGTYIALDMAFDLQSRGHDVNVNKLVTDLREERCLMVQSEAQFVFLHEVILEAHISSDTRVPVTECKVIFPGTIDINSENARIDKEFQMLHDLGQFSPKNKHTTANLPENLDKNRNMDALPDDGVMVYLGAHVRGRNQYINGVYLSSFRHRRGFILTQLPLRDTVVDFWRLVDGSDVTTVVSIGSVDEELSVKDYCHFWPRQVNEVLTTGPYTITLNSVVSAGDHLASNKMTLKAKDDDTGREVEIFHYKNWADVVTGDSSSLLHLVDTVKAIRSRDSTLPVIVQCIDGAAKSGLFCALYDVISRVTYDNDVDVYLTARQVHRVRPQAVASQIQYRFLYKCAQDYIRHQDIYQNADVTQNRY